jgi:hypothetical protein
MICEDRRKELERLCDNARKTAGIVYTPDCPDAWRDFWTIFYRNVKKACGISESVKVSSISDPDLLTRMVAAAQELYS